MSVTTPNIGIYIPADGQTLYGQSFAQGMVNIDQHDHSGGPNKGLPIGSAGVADGSITYPKLNANVADVTTGIGVNAILPNQLQILGVLRSIFQIAAATGLIAKNGTNATAVTISGTANQISVASGDGSAGNPIISFTPVTTNPTQPCFNYGVGGVTQLAVTGDGTDYVVQFPDASFYGEFQQGANYDGTSIFTAPIAGVYLISSSLKVTNINVGGSNSTQINATVNVANQYTFCYLDSSVVTKGDQVVLSGSQLVKLAPGDTVTINLRINNGLAVKYANVTDGNFSVILFC